MYARDLTAERGSSRRTAIPYLSALAAMSCNTGSVTAETRCWMQLVDDGSHLAALSGRFNRRSRGSCQYSPR